MSLGGGGRASIAARDEHPKTTASEDRSDERALEDDRE
jgi:hypothetical protein